MRAETKDSGSAHHPGPAVDDVEAAVDKALRILRAAGQTRAGLNRKLRQAGYAPAAADAACDRVAALGYVNDRAFAEATVRRRRQQGRGLRLIASELHHKGIDGELVAELLKAVSIDDEIEAAVELAQQLLRRQAGQPRQRERVMGSMLRRGYPPSVVRRALEKASE